MSEGIDIKKLREEAEKLVERIERLESVSDEAYKWEKRFRKWLRIFEVLEDDNYWGDVIVIKRSGPFVKIAMMMPTGADEDILRKNVSDPVTLEEIISAIRSKTPEIIGSFIGDLEYFTEELVERINQSRTEIDELYDKIREINSRIRYLEDDP